MALSVRAQMREQDVISTVTTPATRTKLEAAVEERVGYPVKIVYGDETGWPNYPWIIVRGNLKAAR